MVRSFESLNECDIYVEGVVLPSNLENKERRIMILSGIAPLCRLKWTTDAHNFVKDHVATGANNMKIALQLQNSGMNVRLKDISNIKQKVKRAHPTNCVESMLKILTKNQAVFEVKVDENNMFEGLFYTTPLMKHAYTNYPEILMMDATYKLSHPAYPVVIAGVVDGNGATKIVAVGLLPHEFEVNYVWFIEAMKKHIPATQNTVAFVSDKSAAIRNAITSTMKGVVTYICTFHVLKAFTVHLKKLKLSEEEYRQMDVALINMTYAAHAEEYDRLYEKFLGIASDETIDYYNANWHNIKEQWVRCFLTKNFHTFTNNRIESMNQKLKQFFSEPPALTIFIESLFGFFQVLENERSNEALQLFCTNLVYPQEPVQEAYYKHLTEYANKWVFRQLTQTKDVIFEDEITDIFKIKSKSCKTLIYETTFNSCTCFGFVSMKLPCTHILKVRQHLQLPLFASNLCDERWCRSYFYASMMEMVQLKNQNNGVEETVHQPFSPSFLEAQAEQPFASSVSEPIHAGEGISPTNGSVVSKEVEDFNSQIAVESIPISAKSTLCRQLFNSPATAPVDVTVPFEDCSYSQTTENEMFDYTKELFDSPQRQQNKTDSVPVISTLTINQDSRVSATLQDVCSDDQMHTETELKELDYQKKSIQFPILKGHLKGLPKTVMGRVKTKSGPQPFDDLEDNAKALFLLKLLMTREQYEAKSIGINKITNEEIDYPNIPSYLFFEPKLSVLKRFLTSSCYEHLHKYMKENENQFFICGKCHEDLNNFKSIMCDQCLVWYHYPCELLIVPEDGEADDYDIAGVRYFCVKCKGD
ncbi:hypothetical protein TKK_0010577 [Trichogramma kaykai]|uniref:SWIM-type domain-containing protein n=1 Tax=Trichogramma kaykai TaxID=54128 RepID=A0ABD2WVH9_9HYME